MPRYVWEGKSKTGSLVQGELEAPNEAVVMAQLRRQQVYPTKIKPKGLSLELKIPGIKKKIPEKDIAVFTRQFATMIDAGLPLVQCLDILGSQQTSKAFKAVIEKVKEDVESGSTFADALRKHPKVFDELFVNLVEAGEVGGILDTIFSRLAAYKEKAIKLKKQIKGAMIYPSTIVSVAVIVTAILLIYVIPIFSKMFQDFGQALPSLTQFVIDLSLFTRKYFYLFILAFIMFVIFIRMTYKNPKGRLFLDKVMLKSPIFGDLILKIAIARFSRTLSTMVSSGVPILESLDIVGKSAGNKVVEGAIFTARESISEGNTIAEPMEQGKVFPPMVTQMISVGEATGALDQMLSKIADFYEDEVDAAVAALTSLLEPLLMIFLGVMIGGLVIAMYLPIFKLAGVVGG
ncbi:MAG: type II secretion system F family protein [Deltaproteobacteria bacterium]|nr:type II secretion system F family protein [Deltaproteobacteria bacterium]NIS76386.1 type II secretion system F family protein [Deltaproteobacteria bacterium]